MRAYFPVTVATSIVHVPQINADIASGRLPPYRGIDREPWRCVLDAYYLEKRIRSDLEALLRGSSRTYLGNLSFGTCETAEKVQQLLETCDSAAQGNVEILGVGPVGPIDSTDCELTRRGYSFGFDAYADGYGSLISLGLYSGLQQAGPFRSALNQSGLFDSVTDLMAYCRFYQSEAAVQNMEPIHDLADVWVYEVVSAERPRSLQSRGWIQR